MERGDFYYCPEYEKIYLCDAYRVVHGLIRPGLAMYAPICALIHYIDGAEYLTMDTKNLTRIRNIYD